MTNNIFPSSSGWIFLKFPKDPKASEFAIEINLETSLRYLNIRKKKKKQEKNYKIKFKSWNAIKQLNKPRAKKHVKN